MFQFLVTDEPAAFWEQTHTASLALQELTKSMASWQGTDVLLHNGAAVHVLAVQGPDAVFRPCDPACNSAPGSGRHGPSYKLTMLHVGPCWLPTLRYKRCQCKHACA